MEIVFFEMYIYWVFLGWSGSSVKELNAGVDGIELYWFFASGFSPRPLNSKCILDSVVLSELQGE